MLRILSTLIVVCFVLSRATTRRSDFQLVLLFLIEINFEFASETISHCITASSFKKADNSINTSCTVQLYSSNGQSNTQRADEAIATRRRTCVTTRYKHMLNVKPNKKNDWKDEQPKQLV